MNILVDIDDTTGETQRQALLHINQRSSRPYIFEELTRSFREGKEKEYDELFRDFLQKPELIGEVKPTKRALNALQALHGAGHTIHIASARKEVLHQITEDWLKLHGFADYVHHIHPRQDHEKTEAFKIRVARDNSILVAFDDTYRVAEALSGVGVTTYLIDKPWNQDIPESNNIVRAEDFYVGVQNFLKGNHAVL